MAYELPDLSDDPVIKAVVDSLGTDKAQEAINARGTNPNGPQNDTGGRGGNNIRRR